MSNPVLTALRAKRAKLAAERDAVLEAPERENRDLTPEEASKFDSMRGRIAKVDLEIIEQEERETRQNNVNRMARDLGNVGPQRMVGYGNQGYHLSGGETYSRGDPLGHSWVKDMCRSALTGDPDSAERLRRNNAEVASVRALNTTPGTIGEFVPPLWLIDEYVRFVRAGRVTANQIRQAALPTGTNSINLPKLTSGTATAQQTTQNTTVQNTDAISSSVTASVATIAGQQIVSLQLIEQSPVNMDEVLLTDLLADLAQKIDIFVLSNNVANQIGLLNVAGLNSISFTGTSASQLYSKGAGALNAIQTSRFLPADKWFMHPRRWNWIMTALDTANRPMVVPNATMSNEAVNALGTSVGTVNIDGLVGTWLGLPVFVDANIPTNLGASSTEDRIIAVRSDDIILYEGTPRAEVFRETKADQLSILIRVYNYLALHSARYPQSIAVISGGGMTPPVF